jgi:hypothetical protein
MTYIVPKIDNRSQEDLAGEIRRLILEYCPEYSKQDVNDKSSTEEIESDKQANALINIFSTMMGHVIDALNQSPEKNYTAFLNLIGISPTPPRVAKAPIMFKLKEDWDKDGFIPAGTKISAQPENQEEVVFETENDLTVIRPKLVKAVSIDPRNDRWSDQDFLISSESTGAEAELFNVGDTRILHRMYIGDSKLFGLKEKVNIGLAMTPNPSGSEDLQIQWYYYDAEGNSIPLSDKTGILPSGQISFLNVNGISPKTISGYDKNSSLKNWTNNWIYAELKSALKEDINPQVDHIKIDMSVSAESMIPEMAVFNESPINLTKDFYPLGERPVFNDTFYIASSEAFSKEDAIITIGIKLSDGVAPPDTESIALAWEYWNGIRWEEIGRASNKAWIENYIDDDTKAFTQSGDIKFINPAMKTCFVNGQENYWLRVRLIGGDYGKDGYINPTTDAAVPAVYVKPDYQPPVIKELTIGYNYTPLEKIPDAEALELEMAFSDGSVLDLTDDFYPFGKNAAVNNTFYIACSEAFSKKDSNIIIDVMLSDENTPDLQKTVLAWEYWDGTKWQEIDQVCNKAFSDKTAGVSGTNTVRGNSISKDTTRAFTGTGCIIFTCPKIKSCIVNGRENYWIRVRIIEGNYEVEGSSEFNESADKYRPPLIKKMLVRYTYDSPLKVPDTALSGNPENFLTKLDMTADFYPFGENDTFYIACREAFSNKDSRITIGIMLSDTVSISENTEAAYSGSLVWEYWDGSGWNETVQILEDTTETLTKCGHIVFKCPEIKSCILGEEKENFWIRARITGANCQENISTGYADSTALGYCSRKIKKITVKYEYSYTKIYPEQVITENNFILSDKTNDCLKDGKTFKPFSNCSDKDQTFYLAFDRDISNLPLSLFFPLSGDQIGNDPVVAWEYWNGRNWLTLSVNDAIRDFTRREIQQINIPSDIERCVLFGTDCYWIRARLETDGDKENTSYEVYPKIKAVYSNVVWARNLNTVADEIIGSSNGEPSQTFQFSRTPVLSGQVVKVHETLGREEWTTWEEVQTFSLSDTDSRHYVVDSQSGTLTFGDGKNGMVPPAGTDNIKCDYRYGGGVSGNVEEESISKLWDNFPAIDSVTNPIAADGGFDQEEIEDTKARGPYTLKNRDRGVTCEDIEWLVREAAPQLAIVKCFPTMDRELDFTPGKATVIVVPEYKDPKPVPSQELLSEIDTYLTQRISAVLAAEDSKLDVIGPDYISVGVEANVEYTASESGKIIEGRIIDNLKEFLNPLYGGQERKGWQLGKNLYISEICSEIKNTPGVDYIKDITIKASVQCYTLNLEQSNDNPLKPCITYPTYSAVKSSDNRIVFALAQKLPANKEVKTILAKGFRENHKLKLSYRNYPKKDLVVVSVDGDILECEIDGEPLENDYPAGSDIEAKVTENLTIRSYILSEITGNPSSFFIKIAVPEMNDIVYLSRNDEYTNTMALKIREVKSENIFLEEDELVYSGIHLINKKPDLKFPYLLNTDTNVIHDLSKTSEQCCLGEILKEDRKYMEADTTDAIRCKYCFPSEE